MRMLALGREYQTTRLAAPHTGLAVYNTSRPYA